jgi:hypothetical protein
VLGDDSSSNSPEFSLDRHFISPRHLTDDASLALLARYFLLAASAFTRHHRFGIALSNFNRGNRSRHSAPTYLT